MPRAIFNAIPDKTGGKGLAWDQIEPWLRRAFDQPAWQKEAAEMQRGTGGSAPEYTIDERVSAMQSLIKGWFGDDASYSAGSRSASTFEAQIGLDTVKAQLDANQKAHDDKKKAETEKSLRGVNEALQNPGG